MVLLKRNGTHLATVDKKELISNEPRPVYFLHLDRPVEIEENEALELEENGETELVTRFEKTTPTTYGCFASRRKGVVKREGKFYCEVEHLIIEPASETLEVSQFGNSGSLERLSETQFQIVTTKELEDQPGYCVEMNDGKIYAIARHSGGPLSGDTYSYHCSTDRKSLN